ncbi:MAG TPA: NlpC/P60 family protein, partial [Candidatus Anoxymicrobiaceae bacterium]
EGEKHREVDSIFTKRPRTELILGAALIVMLVLMLVPATFAQTLDQQRTDAKTSVDQLQQKMESAVERYNYACSKLEQTRGAISDNKVKLTAAEEELAANKVRLNSRVRAMYVNPQSSFVEVVVNAKDFDKFLVGLDLAKKVGQKDASLVKQVKESRARLEAARTALQEQKAAQESARQEIASAKANVESELSNAKGKLGNIDSQIQTAMARRAAEASAASSGSRRSSYPSYSPTARRSIPPGVPHGGVVGVAYAQLGKPYVWGAEGPDAFDCSGLTMYCYRVGAGISISHSSYAQASCGASVGVSELAPGDILGFRGWGHVGLYVGGGEFIQAPQTGDVVKVSSLASRSNFCGAVRP